MTSEEQQPNEVSSIEAIAKIAEKRRNEIRQNVEAATVPDYLIDVQQTEASYVLDPKALPYEYVDLEKLDDSLKKLYGLQRAKALSFNQDSADDPLQQLLGPSAETQDNLRYTKGKFPLSKKDFIPIRDVVLTRERVHIVLKGDSSISDALVADVVESLWLAAGISKSWDTIRKALQLTAFGTATKLRLPVPMESFIDPRMLSFVEKDCLDGQKFAHKMGLIAAEGVQHRNQRLHCSFAVDDIRLRFSIFDAVSGLSESSQLTFTVGAKNEYGTGIYTVISELKYDLHMKAVSKLLEHMQTKP